MSNIIQEMSTLSMKDYIIKNHELDKFKLLYLENAPRLIFYASKYVDSDTAEDLVHDIFIKIWQKKEIYSVEEGLKTYLFRSVQNACRLPGNSQVTGQMPRGFYVGLCGREEISGDRRNAKYLSTYGRGATL